MTHLTDATTAVSSAVSDGASLYLGGFTHLISFALGHEIIRQRYDDLHLIRATTGWSRGSPQGLKTSRSCRCGVTSAPTFRSTPTRSAPFRTPTTTAQTRSPSSPLNLDVAVVRAQRADESGNAHLWGISGEIVEVAFAADTVVLRVEEIVDKEAIRSDPNRTSISGNVVDDVVREPYGSHLSYAQGYYDRDNEAYLE